MRAARPRPAEEAGVTLIEVLITTMVLGVLATGVVACIVLFFRTADRSGSRLSLSHDSQLLANYLIPDLDSLTSGGQPAITSASPGPCPGSSGLVVFDKLTIQYTDYSSGQVYVATYAVDGRFLTRTLGGSTTTVVHNLIAGGACFSALPKSPPWTMRITAEANHDATTDYSFSVSGGGRVTTPTLPGPPKPLSATSRDTSGDSRIDAIDVTFDQPLNRDDAAGNSQWAVTNPPSGARLGPAPPLVSGSTVRLFLTPGAAVDTTSPPGFTVSLGADATGIRNSANQQAVFDSQAVRDGIAPSLQKIESKDTDGDGKIDHITAQFSEALGHYAAGIAPWTISGQPVGVARSSVAVSGDTATLSLIEGAAVDTVADGLEVALSPDPDGIADTNGNFAAFGPVAVNDGMAPVMTLIQSKDTNANGKVGRVLVTFSEALADYGAENTPWSLSGEPTGVSLMSVDVSGNRATLLLQQGRDQDTAADGFKVALAPDRAGVRDAIGNLSSFPLSTVTDDMQPIVTGISGANAASGTAGVMDPGDKLILGFSESLAATSLPIHPTVTLTPRANGGNDVLTIAGVAEIDLGTTLNTSTVNYGSNLTQVSGQVTITLIGVGSTPVAVGPTLKVTPAPTVMDLAKLAAEGALTIPTPALF